MAIFGSFQTARDLTRGRGASYKAAFDYIAECAQPGTAAHQLVNRLPAGSNERVDLGGGAFALLQVHMTKAPREPGFFESHLAYVDVQAIVSGEEIIEVADVRDLTVSENLTPAQDVITYAIHDKASRLHLHAGEAAVLDPRDGHMSSRAVKEPALVRKVVVKVPVA